MLERGIKTWKIDSSQSRWIFVLILMHRKKNQTHAFNLQTLIWDAAGFIVFSSSCFHRLTPEHDWIQGLGTSRLSPPFPNITEALFHRRGERNACVKSPALIASLTARVPFSHSKADLPSPFRQMHMPTATLPSSGEQSNPLLKKWLIQVLASILFFRWVKKERKKNDLTNYFRSSCSNLAECIW